MKYINFVLEHYQELSLLLLVLIKLIFKIDFTKILRFLPLVKDILDFIEKEAEKYELYAFKKEVERIAPLFYILIENIGKIEGLKGEEKYKLFFEEINKLVNVDCEKKSLIVRAVAEKLNLIQNNTSLAEKILSEVKEKFPVLPFIASILNFVLKILK